MSGKRTSPGPLRRLGQRRYKGMLGGFHSGIGWLFAALATICMFLGLMNLSHTWVIVSYLGAWVGLVGFVVDLVVTTRQERRP